MGEAYFQVKSDSKHPFYVDLDGYKIKATGTRFNICNYPDDNEMSTYLEQGKTRAALIAPLAAFREPPQVAVFTVVRVSDDFERDDVADMYRDSGLDWPVIVDPHVMLAKQFAITIVPAFHIIAKDRTLLTRQVHTIRKPLRNLTFEDMLLRAVKGEPIAAIEFEKPSTTEAQRALLDKPAPDFSLEDVFGNPYTLSGSTDQTPLLIIFWHPECPTCVKAMPVLQDHLRTLMKRYDFNILSVAVLKGESQARDAVDYIERYDLPFPVLADSDAAVGKSYRVNSIPSLYFIDSQGTVRDIISDISDELDRIIDPVIAEIAAPLPGKDK